MLALLICVLFVHQAFSHMEMVSPLPLRSPQDPDVLEAYKGYDMTSPLEADGSNFPCKRYQYNDTNPQAYNVKAVYEAGNTYNLVLQGSATHNGGSCQVSLSYDNGQSFKVIKSIIGGCPLTPSYNFTIPTFAPSSNTVLLSWSWFNIVGNREMYQNCARVQINGSGSLNPRRDQKYAVRRQTSMDALPDMFACNVNNGCRTIERREVVFPNPGSDVVFGTNAIAVEPGPGFVIDAASTTSGPTQTPASTASVPTVTTPSSNATTSAAFSSSTISTTAPLPFLNTSSTVATGQSSSGVNSTSAPPSNTASTTTGIAYRAASSLSTVSTSSDSSVISTLSTPTTTSSLVKTSGPASSSDSTSTTAALASSSSLQSLSVTLSGSESNSATSPTSIQTAPFMFVTTTSPTLSSSTGLPGSSTTMSTSTISPSSLLATMSTVTTSQTPPTTFTTLITYSSTIPAASLNPLPLPCTPGAFACNSPTTFSRCVTNASGSTSYIFFGSVATGTVCQNGQFVRANEGACTPDGELFCNGERSFFLCDHGGLINMGPTAPGTVCRDGIIVAA